MTDNHDSYFFAIRMKRFRLILQGEIWASEEDEFDLICAAALARLDVRVVG